MEPAPHEVSLAAWGAPATVIAGEPFTVTVGVKSAAGCGLAGGRIEIADHAGAALAEQRLGDTPWPGTDALFWAAVEIRAPDQPGPATLLARFHAEGLAEPHRDAQAAFNVMVVARPEHRLTVKVAADATPVAQAHIRLGPHRAVTGEGGTAELGVAKGRYDLVVWKAGYDTPVTPLDIAADASVAVEAVAQPADDPDARWTA